MQGSSDEVEGQGMRHSSLSEEPEVEGHAVRYKFRDADGNEFDIPEDRIISVTTPDGEEVEGHAFKFRVPRTGARGRGAGVQGQVP